MPNAPTHDRITTVGTILAGPIALHATHSVALSAIAAGAFFFSGYMFGPDLDLPQSRPSKRWGQLKFIWAPYRKLIPYHRHPLSHWPIIGTAFRIIYISPWIVLAVMAGLAGVGAVAKANDLPWDSEAFVWWLRNWNWTKDWMVRCGAIGLEAGAAAHYIADYAVSWLTGKSH